MSKYHLASKTQTSVAGLRGRKFNTFYGSAKSGLISYLSSLRQKFNNQIIEKLEKDLDRFGFNVVIASIHKIYTFYSQQTNKKDWGSNFYENYTNILKVISPILPHFSNECLEKLKQKVSEIRWPKVNKKYLEEEVINIVTQVNGKKRKVFPVSKALDKETLVKDIKNDPQIKKYLDNKEIIKTIYVENKLINFIIKK